MKRSGKPSFRNRLGTEHDVMDKPCFTADRGATMKIVRIDEKLKRNCQFHPFLVKGNSIYGVIYRPQRATR